MSTEFPTKASVVVIGGGIIGTSIAFHLAEAGVTDVVLLEKGELAGGSTSKAAGGIRATFSSETNIHMGLRSLDAYSRFPPEIGQDIDFSRIGYLFLLSANDDVAAFEHSVAIQNRYGIPSRMITAEEAQKHNPLISTNGLLAACWSPLDAKATPESVVLGYATAARKHGAQIIRHCAVTGIERDGRSIVAVETTRGRIRTDTVVCAAGAWSRTIGAMLDVSIPVTPIRSQVAFMDGLKQVPCGKVPLTVDFGSGLYFHPERNGLLLGWSDPDEPESFDCGFELDNWLTKVGEIASVRIPQVLDCGIRTGWAGLYERTPDHNPIIGRIPGLDGLVLATGFSAHGFMMGPAAGEIVRDLYLGKKPGFDVAGFAFDRFTRADANPMPERNVF
ncbi:NAD(P)/FAD-dependent oxidoreductase [Rhodococcus rhodochrous]|uniref:Sarcosine oxidase subunit beta n=1 Tax=Rhodococcus rhodochrous KG-21 TaxID=1441923 RepID=A0A0M8PJK0_RHORH|nr:FAD-binding oxidoreductase [Rhodococcus rhodochrous]KOS57606.1 sarcosine oxidase subunit beta [Rhodococcus rhodochrous KG-21]